MSRWSSRIRPAARLLSARQGPHRAGTPRGSTTASKVCSQFGSSRLIGSEAIGDKSSSPGITSLSVSIKTRPARPRSPHSSAGRSGSASGRCCRQRCRRSRARQPVQGRRCGRALRIAGTGQRPAATMSPHREIRRSAGRLELPVARRHLTRER